MSAFSAVSGDSSSACCITALPAASSPILHTPAVSMSAPQQRALFQAAETEQRRLAAMHQLSERMSAMQQSRMEALAYASQIGLVRSSEQSRLEAPRLSGGFSYSVLDLNAAMRNQALRERALSADSAVLQERSAAEAAAFEAKKLERLLEAAEKEAEHARHVAESAFREAEEAAQRQVEEAVRQAEESQREVEEAKRRVEEGVEKSRQAAAEAMEHPEEVELAALPDRIAEARFYECADAEKIAEAERIYKKRAVAAFHLENAQERLLRAVAQGRADKGTNLLRPAAGTVVRRVVALPLPTLTVTTTRTVPLPLKEEGEGKALSEEDDKSTAASDESSEA